MDISAWATHQLPHPATANLIAIRAQPRLPFQTVICLHLTDVTHFHSQFTIALEVVSIIDWHTLLLTALALQNLLGLLAIHMTQRLQQLSYR